MIETVTINGKTYYSAPERHLFWILLLEQEVEALRSVLSEFEGDKLEYLQMVRANALEDVRNSLVRPGL